MPVQEFIFTVNLPVKAAWSFMNNRKEIGLLFPGCKNVTLINETDSLWTVTFSLGFLSRTIEMKGYTTELVEYKRLAWTATNENLVTAGTIALRPLSPDETEITYRLEGHARGSFSLIQNVVFAVKFGELTRDYMIKIREHLEKKAADAVKKTG